MSISTWFHSLLGTVETKAETIEPEILAWAKNFLSGITPVIKQAATNAVLAAISVPGTGTVKAAAAFAAASGELISQGVPIVENDLKAAIQIAYNALPASITGNAAAAAVATAASNEVSALAAKADPASAGTAPAMTAAAS